MITHTFLPQFIGGRENHVYYLSKELTKRGHEVCIFTSGSNKRPVFKEYEEIMTFRFPFYLLNLPGKRERIPYRTTNPHVFIKALRKYNPDVVHAHDYRHFSTDMTAIYSRTKSKPFIVTIHGFFYHIGRGFKTLMNIYDNSFGRFSLKTADKIICVSNMLAEQRILARFRNKIAVIPNGVPAELATNRQEFSGDFKQKNGVHQKMILAVGRLSTQKGFQYLIRAYKKIAENDSGYCLYIVGPEADCGDELRRFARDTNSIVFTGPISNHELRDAYVSADLFVLPSLSEACPLTLLEAMRFGKPIVATSVGTIPEIIKDRVDGILVEPGNSESLAMAMKEVLSDDNLARNISKNAQTDSTVIWENFISKTQDVYEEIVSGKNCW